MCSLHPDRPAVAVKGDEGICHDCYGVGLALKSRRRRMHIDLAGSTTHDPAFLSVTLTVDPHPDWTDEELIAKAAAWGGVPVEQVTLKEPRRASS